MEQRGVVAGYIVERGLRKLYGFCDFCDPKSSFFGVDHEGTRPFVVVQLGMCLFQSPVVAKGQVTSAFEVFGRTGVTTGAEI